MSLGSTGRALAALGGMLCAGLVPVGCGTREYAAAPLAGRVVDAATGEGIPGVVVLAQWVLQGGIEGGNVVGALEVREAVTDDAGRYSIAGWGPKPARVEGRAGVLEARDPVLHVLKAGYAYLTLWNESPPRPPDWDSPLRRSAWNGRDIRLVGLGGDTEAEREAYDHFVLAPPVGIAAAGCAWHGMPLTVRFLVQEGARLRARGARTSDFTLVDERCPLPAWYRELSQ